MDTITNNVITNEAVKYFYVIHGTIPELMPSVAYRRTDRDVQHERKILKCPACMKRLTDMSLDTRVELFKHPIQVTVNCQFYMKCSYCNTEIGINIAA